MKIHLLIIKAYETMKNFKSVALHYAHIVDLHESAVQAKILFVTT